MRNINEITTLESLFNLGMDREIVPLAAMKPGGKIINVGAGNKRIIGTWPCDWPQYNADKGILPFEDNSLDGICAFHFLEHVAKPASVLADFQRVLRVGGLVNIVVPYYNSQMQAQDLDHKACYCEMTWKTLFSNPYYDKNAIEWRLVVRTNVIMGIVERNLCLVTQLVKI